MILKPIFEFQQISNNLLVIKKNIDSKNISNQNDITNKYKINNEEYNLNSKIDINNNFINNDIKNNNELKIDQNENYNIFQKFENCLAIIIEKNALENQEIEELKQLSKKFIINDISPSDYATKYFSQIYKYFRRDDSDGDKDVENVLNINKKVFEVLDKLIIK